MHVFSIFYVSEKLGSFHKLISSVVARACRFGLIIHEDFYQLYPIMSVDLHFMKLFSTDSGFIKIFRGNLKSWGMKNLGQIEIFHGH